MEMLRQKGCFLLVTKWHKLFSVREGRVPETRPSFFCACATQASYSRVSDQQVLASFATLDFHRFTR